MKKFEEYPKWIDLPNGGELKVHSREQEDRILNPAEAASDEPPSDEPKQDEPKQEGSKPAEEPKPEPKAGKKGK